MMRMSRSGGWWSRRALLASSTAVAFSIAAAPVSAQTTTTSTGSSDVYEREIYEYPSLNRRDPFRSLNAGEQIGPRFEDLRLTGVLFSDIVGSVATFVDERSGRRHRAREGESLGDARITAIRAGEVDFMITSFGISRVETLRVKVDKESGG